MCLCCCVVSSEYMQLSSTQHPMSASHRHLTKHTNCSAPDLQLATHLGNNILPRLSKINQPTTRCKTFKRCHRKGNRSPLAQSSAGIESTMFSAPHEENVHWSPTCGTFRSALVRRHVAAPLASRVALPEACSIRQKCLCFLLSHVVRQGRASLARR